MSVAAACLALAVLIAPRQVRIPPAPKRISQRPGPWLGIGAGGLAVAVLLPPAAVVATAALTATLADRRRRARRRAAAARDASALQHALDVLVGELRVGAHPVAAFETASGEVQGRTAAALRDVAARARLGVDLATSLRSAPGAASGHWHRLAVYWQLAQTHGLAIAALARAAQRDVVERERFASRVLASMAGARATSAILGGLPVLGIGLGELIGAQPIRFLLGPGVGGWLLVIGVLLVCAGLRWSDDITGRVIG